MWPRSGMGDKSRAGVGFELAGFSLRVSVPIALAVAATLSGSASAQVSLSSQLLDLTDNACENLGIPTSGIPNPELGPNLQFVCVFRSAGPGSGSGTNTASGGSTGGSASGSGMQSSAVRSRLDELREGQEDQDELASVNRTANPVLAQPDVAQQSVDFKRFGLLVATDYDRRDRDSTALEAGYDSDDWALSVAFDYRVSDRLFLGVSPSFLQQSGDFSGGGDFEADTYGVVLYGLYAPRAWEGFFFDVVLGYGWKDFTTNRFTDGVYNGVAVLDTSASGADGDEFSSGLLFGKDFAAGRYTHGVRLGASYVDNNIDPTVESGSTGLELEFDKRSVQSLQSTLGFQGSMAISTRSGTATPQFAIEWVHEYDDDQQNISARFVEDLRPVPTTFTFQDEAPDRDFFNARLGVVVVLPKGVQVFAELRGMFGHEFFSSYGAAAGVRLEL